jgi:hypothetical protein
MDFPLVSVALASDGFASPDLEKIQPWVNILPVATLPGKVTTYLDKRNKNMWTPTGPGQLLVSKSFVCISCPNLVL